MPHGRGCGGMAGGELKARGIDQISFSALGVKEEG